MTPTTRRDLFKLGGGAAAAATLTGGAPATWAAPRASGASGRSALPVGYPLGPFVRDPANPILRPTTRPWESRFVFNPAAIVRGGRVFLLYRAQGPDGRSSIGLATSSDGVRFNRSDQPVMVATEPYELPGGCEDPRVVRVRGTYYMTYTGYDGTSARLCLATSRNLVSWTKHGPLFPDFQTRDVDKPWSKSGAILTTPLNGRYIMYFGDKDIYYAWSTDLIHWTPASVDDPVMRPQPGTYTAELLEPGPPPLVTENGYILLIHNSAARDPDGKLIYRAGQAPDRPGRADRRARAAHQALPRARDPGGDLRAGEQRGDCGGLGRLPRRVASLLRPRRRWCGRPPRAVADVLRIGSESPALRACRTLPWRSAHSAGGHGVEMPAHVLGPAHQTFAGRRPSCAGGWLLSRRLCGARRLVVSPRMRRVGGEGMELKVGNRVEVESESTERRPRMGVVKEVVRAAPSPRYRIRWDDGHESIYTPAAGALRRVGPSRKA